MNYNLNICPMSRLFMRDARPMTGSDVGLGANWPRPDQIWNAILNGFHIAWPEHQSWEHKHQIKEHDKNKNSSCRFGALRTAGPFPCRGGKLYFPTPLDWEMEWVDGYNTNLPDPLSYVARSKYLGKHENIPAWISAEDYNAYLHGQEKSLVELQEDGIQLYDVERDIGIAIDPETGTTKESKFYQAEYIRLREDVSLAVEASCEIKGPGGNKADLFEKIGFPFQLVLGGQRELSLVEQREGKTLEELFPAPTSIPQGTKSPIYVRWTLLSPAVFPRIGENKEKSVSSHPGGWLPNWVATDGNVCLSQKVERHLGESRDEWRKRIGQSGKLSAILVAARIGSSLAFSGWDVQDHAPKPTLLAVPAGSSYIFECADAAKAQALISALHLPNRRSTCFGERGFGMGVCSFVKIKNK